MSTMRKLRRFTVWTALKWVLAIAIALLAVFPI